MVGQIDLLDQIHEPEPSRIGVDQPHPTFEFDQHVIVRTMPCERFDMMVEWDP